MFNRVRQSVLLFAGMFLFMTPALHGEENAIRWSGCSVAKQAFMRGLAQAYEQRTGIKIRVTGTDSTTSIRDTVQGKSDIGGACRVALDTDATERKAHQIPVAWDALVVVVNRDNPLQAISLAQLRALFRGELTDWQQLDGPSLTVERYGRQAPYSDEESGLAELLYGTASELAVERRFASASQILDAIEQDRRAIAIVSLAEVQDHAVKILAVDGVLPSYENIRYGDYALTRPLYLITRYRKQTKPVQQFVRFALSREGQDVIRNLGTVPYAEAIVLVMKQHRRSTRREGRNPFRNRASLN